MAAIKSQRLQNIQKERQQAKNASRLHTKQTPEAAEFVPLQGTHQVDEWEVSECSVCYA